MLVLLWGTISLSLTEIFAPGEWLWWGVLIMAAATFVGSFFRALSPDRVDLATGIGWIAGVVCLAIWFVTSGQGEAWLRDPLAQVNDIVRRIERGVAPVPTAGTLDLALLVTVLLLAVLVSYALVAKWRPFLAGSCMSLLLLVPVATLGIPSTWQLLLAAGVFLALLAWIASPAPSLLGLGAAGLAVAVAGTTVAVLPTTRDRVWGSSVVFSPVSGTVPDVTIALAEDLRARSETTAFSFTGGGLDSYRFTLATLSNFEGGRWYPDDALTDERLLVGEPRVVLESPLPQTLDEALGEDREGTTNFGMPDLAITIEGLRSEWLPLPAGAMRAVDADGADGFTPLDWMWAEASATARSERAITRAGDTYRVNVATTNTPIDPAALGELWNRRAPGDTIVFYTESGAELRVEFAADGSWSVRSNPEAEINEDTLQWVADRLAEEDSQWEAAMEHVQLNYNRYTEGVEVPADVAPYLEVPGTLPRDIAEAAEKIAGGTESRLEVGQALQDWFTSGEFVYDERAPYLPGADPDDPYAVMSALLETRSGFCVHFASTFAVMARELGVPTRIAVGYAARGMPSLPRTVVTGGDLHAWPEIYVGGGTGWVPFEPTPGGAGLRADTNREVPATPDTTPSPSPTEPTPEPTTEPRETPTPNPEDDASTTQPDSRFGNPLGSDGAAAGQAAWWLLGTAALLLILCGPALARQAVAAARRRRIARGDDPATNAWSEWRARVTDLGLAPAGELRADTPEALIEYLEAAGALGIRVPGTGVPGAGAPGAGIPASEAHPSEGLTGPDAVRRLAEAMEVERYSLDGDAQTARLQPHELEALLARACAGLIANRRARVRARLWPRSLWAKAPRP